jgi:hypothetical protein
MNEEPGRQPGANPEQPLVTENTQPTDSVSRDGMAQPIGGSGAPWPPDVPTFFLTQDPPEEPFKCDICGRAYAEQHDLEVSTYGTLLTRQSACLFSASADQVQSHLKDTSCGLFNATACTNAKKRHGPSTPESNEQQLSNTKRQAVEMKGQKMKQEDASGEALPRSAIEMY